MLAPKVAPPRRLLFPLAAAPRRVNGSGLSPNAKTALELRHGIAENPLTSSGDTGCRTTDTRAVPLERATRKPVASGASGDGGYRERGEQGSGREGRCRSRPKDGKPHDAAGLVRQGRRRTRVVRARTHRPPAPSSRRNRRATPLVPGRRSGAPDGARTDAGVRPGPHGTISSRVRPISRRRGTSRRRVSPPARTPPARRIGFLGLRLVSSTCPSGRLMTHS